MANLHLNEKLAPIFPGVASSTVGDEVAVWGRCDYQAAIDNCIFKSGNTDNVGATSSAECENQESIAATASLVNSNAAQLAASGQLQEVNEYFQANGDTNLIAATQNNAATITLTQQPNAPFGPTQSVQRRQHNGHGVDTPREIFGPMRESNKRAFFLTPPHHQIFPRAKKNK